jgi:hypothetical protein
MFLLQRKDTLPLAKGFPNQSCEVTEGVMSSMVQVFPKPCEVARCDWDHGVAFPKPCKVARCE